MAFDTKSTPKKFENGTSSLNEKSQRTKHTSVIVHYDVGFSNNLFIRGSGANLSWEKGTKLRNLKSNQWVWETDLPFDTCEFKVLINDTQYEVGSNHRLKCGDSFDYSPGF